MGNFRIFLIAVFLSFGAAACSTIPENGSVLNASISTGIARNQAETEKIITAFADVQRAILDEKWDEIYKKTENEYVARNPSVPSADNLSHEDRRKIAANAGEVYSTLLGEIAKVEASLIASTRKNSQTLIDMNDEVTKYLASLEDLEEARSAIADKAANALGLDFDDIRAKFDGLAEKLVKGEF